MLQPMGLRGAPHAPRTPALPRRAARCCAPAPPLRAGPATLRAASAAAAAEATADAGAEAGAEAGADAGAAAGEAPKRQKRGGKQRRAPGQQEQQQQQEGQEQQETRSEAKQRHQQQVMQWKRRNMRRARIEQQDAPIVRITEASTPAGAAGCLCKFLGSGEPLVRLVSVNDAALPKSAQVLTMANTMAKQSIGQMLSFQPTVISKRSAEPPTVPEGATTFYAARIAAGDILTDNTLLVTRDTAPDALGRAIIARVSTAGHTVLECLGQAATIRALQGVISARKGLLVRMQDVACIIASAYVTQQPRPQQQEAGGEQAPAPVSGAEGGEHAKEGARAAAGKQQRQKKRRGAADEAGAGAGGGGGGEGGGRRVLANRIVVLECAPRDPSLLRVRSTYGKVGV